MDRRVRERDGMVTGTAPKECVTTTRKNNP
jgi:hypothetical protein